jgi:hypothetical protein
MIHLADKKHTNGRHGQPLCGDTVEKVGFRPGAGKSVEFLAAKQTYSKRSFLKAILEECRSKILRRFGARRVF